MMEQKQQWRAVVQYQHMVAANVFDLVATIQDQAEQTTGVVLDQMPWMTDESRQAFRDWAGAYRSARSQFKDFLDESYRKAEASFSA